MPFSGEEIKGKEGQQCCCSHRKRKLHLQNAFPYRKGFDNSGDTQDYQKIEHVGPEDIAHCDTVRSVYRRSYADCSLRGAGAHGYYCQSDYQ